jgi:hypothetical protein
MYEENLIFFFISVMCVLACGVSERVEDDFSPSDNISGLETGIPVAVNVLEVKIILVTKGEAWQVASAPVCQWTFCSVI